MIFLKSAFSRLGCNNRKSQVLVFCRLKTAWIKASSSSFRDGSNVNVEELFVDETVQSLLQKLTGLNEEKIFAERSVHEPQRSHYALMTDSMLEEAKSQMRERGKRLLQFVPVKEPRSETFSVLSEDSEIAGFDSSKFVFTDITFDATNQDRTVVIREPDGTLRTALPEEHDRMNRVFYEMPNRPINVPPVFKDPQLADALNDDKHEFVMDFACWYYEPDDPEFVKLSHTVFDRTVEKNKFSVLYSTRHFGAFAFYLVLNNNIPPLLNFYGSLGSIHDATNVIRLQKIVYPNWRTEISFQDSDDKIVRDFINQNRRLRDSLPELLTLLEKRKTEKKVSQKPSKSEDLRSKQGRQLASVTRENIRTEEGPLGKLASDYRVKSAWNDRKVKDGDSSDPAPVVDSSVKSTNPTQRQRRRSFQKVSTLKEKLAEIDDAKNKKD